MGESDGTTGPEGSPGDGDTGDKAKDLLDAEGWPKWLGQSPDKHKRNEAFKGHGTIGVLQDDYLKVKSERDEAVKSKETMLAIPTDDSTDEDIQTFYNSLGRPEKIEDYKFEKIKFPEGMTKSEELEKEFIKLSHSIGLTNPQAESLYAFYNKLGIGAFNAQKQAEEDNVKEVEKAHTERIEALKKEWGKDYEANLEYMKRAMKQFGGEEFEKLMDDTKMGNDPIMIQAFVNIGKKMGEGTLIEGVPAAGGEKKTEEEILKEKYPDMVKDGIPYRQELAPKEEPGEDLKARFPDMEGFD